MQRPRWARQLKQWWGGGGEVRLEREYGPQTYKGAAWRCLRPWAPPRALVGREGQREEMSVYGAGQGDWVLFFWNWKYIGCDFFFLKQSWGENDLFWESSDCKEVRGQRVTVRTDSQDQQRPRRWGEGDSRAIVFVSVQEGVSVIEV